MKKEKHLDFENLLDRYVNLVGSCCFIIGIFLLSLPLFWESIFSNLISNIGVFISTSIAIAFIHGRYIQKYDRKFIISEIQRTIFNNEEIIKNEFFYFPKNLLLSKENEKIELKNDAKIIYTDNHKTTSDKLIILLHGLGLDNNDFEEYMGKSEYRCIAPSMFGFNEDNLPANPISFDNHCILMKEFINDIIRRIDPEETILVGFSIGADLAFRLVEKYFEEDELKKLKIYKFLSLDCNIDKHTCFFSSLISKIDYNNTNKISLIEIVKNISDQAFENIKGDNELSNWVNINEYLVKVFSKFSYESINIPIEFSKEIHQLYNTDNYIFFIKLYGNVTKKIIVKCIFSSSNSKLKLFEMEKKAKNESSINTKDFRKLFSIKTVDHFALIDKKYLSHYIKTFIET